MYFFSILTQYSYPILCCYCCVLLTGSLWPRYYGQYGEESMGIMPKEGDNFKVANIQRVYRLENHYRRPYASAEAFFSYSENEPFDTPYEEGGILICDEAVLDSFPLGLFMGEALEDDAKKLDQQSMLMQQIFRKDKLGHLIAYMLLALCSSFYVRRYRWSKKKKIIIILSIGAAMGLIIECLQAAFVPGRAQESLDMIFNVLGLVSGGLIYLYLRYWMKKKIAASQEL